MLALVMSMLGHQVAERGRAMVETAKLRAIFAIAALAFLVPALIFSFYALYLWLAIHLGPLTAAAILAAVFLFLTALAVACVVRPPGRRRHGRHRAAHSVPPQTEAVVALEQLGHALGQLRPGLGNTKTMLGLLGIIALIGYGIGRSRR